MPDRTDRHRWWLRLASVVVVVGLAASCSGGDDSGGAEAATADRDAATTTAAEATTTTINQVELERKAASLIEASRPILTAFQALQVIASADPGSAGGLQQQLIGTSLTRLATAADGFETIYDIQQPLPEPIAEPADRINEAALVVRDTARSVTQCTTDCEEQLQAITDNVEAIAAGVNEIADATGLADTSATTTTTATTAAP